MSYKVPEFPLTCDIYTGPWASKVLRLSSPCNLQVGRRSFTVDEFLGEAAGRINAPLSLLLPPRTDVRSFMLTGVNDVVELPAGSGRWYEIAFVEDVGRGFDNEFRMARLGQISEYMGPAFYSGLFWPVPMP